MPLDELLATNVAQ